MPKNQQKMPHSNGADHGRHQGIASAASVFPEKSTMPNIVFATAVEMNVMPTKPTKLNTAAEPMAASRFVSNAWKPPSRWRSARRLRRTPR